MIRRHDVGGGMTDEGARMTHIEETQRVEERTRRSKNEEIGPIQVRSAIGDGK